MEASECGAASLAMILSYYGQDTPLEQLRIETDVTRDGCNAGNIIRAAQDRGFDCGGYRKSAETMLEIDPPCVVFWEKNHFVVFEGIKGDYVYINDPAFGERKLTIEDFSRAYSGIALQFRPPEGVPQKPERKLLDKGKQNTLDRIKGVIKEEPLAVTMALCMSLLTALGGVVISVWNGRIGLLLPVVLLCLCCLFLRNRFITDIRRRYTAIGSSRFLETLFALPMAFFEQRYPGDITARVSGEERAGRFVAETSLYIFSDLLMVVVFLVALLIVDPKGWVVGVVCIAAGIAAAAFLQKDLAYAYNRLQVQRNRLAGRLFAAMSNTEMIKSTGSEQKYGMEEWALQQQVEETMVEIRGRIRGAWVAVIAGELVALTVVLLWRGIAAGLLLFFLAAAVNLMIKRSQGYRSVEQDLMRTADVQSYLPDRPEPSDTEYEKLQGNIVFDNVTFGYGTRGKPLIEGFSRKIDSGRCIGVTGGTGSGKSTLLKLIAGLYEPDSGTIYFDKREKNAIPKGVLNTSIAFAMQKPQLFPGTIRDNITMWNPSITEQDMKRAAKDACIHDVIVKREDGYDGQVKENGTNFSGGQKQRIEIARALAMNPSILILDEITSGLDKITAEQIIRNIQKRGCTCIIASYQQSIVEVCDEIIEL